jgi:HTH-type transcriptional regulator/antitoxin HigA
MGSHRTPGQLLAQLIEDRGWTQHVLAVVLGMNKAAISQLVAGKRDLDAELALRLGEIFDVPAEQLMELQKSYELSRARITQAPDPALSRRAALYGALPIPEMARRGWISVGDVKDVETVERAVAQFFGVQAGEDIPVLAHAAKKTGDRVVGTTPVQRAWLYRVKQIASEMVVPRFTVEGLRAALSRLAELRAAAEEARHVSRILGEAGIRLVLVESLPGAKIDGACMWLNPASPVVGMSMRFDRIDNFWFVLRHELEHVLRGHGRAEPMLDSELEGDNAGVGDDLPIEEREANEAALEFCVPQKDLDSFIARKAPFFADRDVVGFAAKRRIHPGLVAGQIRHRVKRWDLFNKHLVKIRFAVAPGAMVDGWGDIAPIQQVRSV